ncbi:MAG: ribose-phosphate diphosphokinase [Nitrososphaera sp.]
MPDISVVAGPASPDLAARIAEHLGAELVIAELKIFSDGESRLSIGNTKKNCIVVQSTYPPVDTHIMQALMLAKKCDDDGASDVCVVVPYLAYARQDRAFLEGEAISISLLAKLVSASGIKNLITVDIHSQRAMSYFDSIGIRNVSSIPLLAEYAKGLELHNPIAVSPDAGGEERVREFANHLGSDFMVLRKSRNRSTGEVKVDGKLDIEVAGRDAILVDDMISSGGSVIRAAEILKRGGARKVYAMCAHALMTGDAGQKIKEAGVTDIIGTNSIPNQYARVDLSPALASEVSSLYSA